jgi:Domain of unknown function (DUF4232)
VVAGTAGLALGAYAIAGGFTGNGSSGEARARAPLCRSSQLRTVPIGFGTAPGDNHDIGGLDITNTSSTACSLPGGVPRVSAYFGGEMLSVSQLAPDGSVPNSHGPAAHVLEPGKRAYTVFHWSNWCGPPKRSATPGAHVMLRYAFRGGLVLAEKGVPVPSCAASNSPSTIRVAGPLRG